MDLALRWTISGPGSADLYWAYGEDRIRVHVSYIGAGIEALVQSAVDLKLGSGATFITFSAEPGGIRMFFSGVVEGGVFVQIVQFPDIRDSEVWWKDGVVVWKGRVNVGDYISAVRTAAESVIARYGSNERYFKAWQGVKFPSDGLEFLQS
jgi:hypothetical protein